MVPIIVPHRLPRDWSWLLTQPSHQTLGKILAIMTYSCELTWTHWSTYLTNVCAACCFSTWVTLATWSVLCMLVTNCSCWPCDPSPNMELVHCNILLWLAVRFHVFASMRFCSLLFLRRNRCAQMLKQYLTGFYEVLNHTKKCIWPRGSLSRLMSSVRVVEGRHVAIDW